MVSLSHLFIDKIALTIPVQSQSLQHGIAEQLRACAEARIIESVLYGDLLLRYFLAYSIPLAGGRSAVVQIAPRGDGLNYFRCEYNPSSRGLANEHPFSLIAGILFPAWAGFASSLEHARINRMDFAIDIHGVPIDRLGVHHSSRSTFSRQYGRDGRITGLYLGKRTSERHVVIYDKKREARACHARILRGERTRVEIRTTDIGPLSAVANMRNPFSAIAISIYPPHDADAHGYAHFLDSCRFRGVQAALHLVQNRRKRAEYRDWLNQNCTPPWWDAGAIWAQRMTATRRALGV